VTVLSALGIEADPPDVAEDPERLRQATLDRAFDGDEARLDRFLSILTPVLPPGTRLFLRGSAVSGESYKTKEPFDADGPGTSDLDIVVSGPEAMDLFADDGFYLPRVNSRPLCDHDRAVAPALDTARSQAQDLMGRPVSIQAMAEWFLDIRSATQGTPHLFLGEVPVDQVPVAEVPG
jgi:hypothetical protein